MDMDINKNIDIKKEQFHIYICIQAWKQILTLIFVRIHIDNNMHI